MDLAGLAQGGTTVAARLYYRSLNNNHFADALPIWDGTPVHGSNVWYTTEELEDTLGGLMASTAWFKWIAGASGEVQVDTIGSDFDTVLAVWSGQNADNTLSTIDFVTSDDDGSGFGLTSQCTFTAVAGQAYYFQIAGYGGSPGIQGNYTLNYPPGVEPGVLYAYARGKATVTGVIRGPLGSGLAGSVDGATVVVGSGLGQRVLTDLGGTSPIEGLSTVGGVATLERQRVISLMSVVGSGVKPTAARAVATGSESTTDRASTLTHYYV